MAVFDDINTPGIFQADTASIFRLIIENEDELLQRKNFTKLSRKKNSLGQDAAKRKIGTFETIVIAHKRKKRSLYMYRIADEHYDYNGENISAEGFYIATRQIPDVAYSIAGLKR